MIALKRKFYGKKLVQHGSILLMFTISCKHLAPQRLLNSFGVPKKSMDLDIYS